jgi:hypothetical protein
VGEPRIAGINCMSTVFRPNVEAMTMDLEHTKLDIPILQPGEKIIGHAYVTEEGEIVFTPPHSGAKEVVLIEARAGSSGPWAVRLRPALRVRAGGASV